MSTQLRTSALPIITVIGSLNADLTTYTSRIPNGGETLHANSFKVSSGGKGGNQACACAKLSRKYEDLQTGSVLVKMVGAVGNDAHGSMLLQDLQSTGIDTSGVAVKGDVETGVAVILVEAESGENRILLSAGANYSLTPTQFKTLPLPLRLRSVDYGAPNGSPDSEAICPRARLILCRSLHSRDSDVHQTASEPQSRPGLTILIS